MFSVILEEQEDKIVSRHLKEQPIISAFITYFTQITIFKKRDKQFSYKQKNAKERYGILIHDTQKSSTHTLT